MAPTGARIQLGQAMGGADTPTWLTSDWAFCTVNGDGFCSFIIPVSALTGGSFTVRPVAGSDGFVPVDAGPSRIVQALSPNNAGEVVDAEFRLAIVRPNPVLEPKVCDSTDPLTMALVVDLSVSVEGSPLVELKAAASGFVDALAGTNTMIRLITFASTSPVDGSSNQNRPLTSVNTTAGVESIKDWIDGWVAMGGTNWSAGLQVAADDQETYDLVLFLTDGQPNGFMTGLSPAETAALPANALKTEGAKIMGFAIGDAPEKFALNPISRAVLLTTARAIPWTSIPGCFQKFWSSAAINALTNCGGTSIKSINTRRSSAYSINNEPSDAYNRVATGGAYVANFL